MGTRLVRTVGDRSIWSSELDWRNCAQAAGTYLWGHMSNCDTVSKYRYRMLLLPISLFRSPMVGVLLKMWCSRMQLSAASSDSIDRSNVSQMCAGAKIRAWVWLGRDQPSAKLKSANICIHAGYGQSAKFNSRQICRLYGINDFVPPGYYFTGS